MSGAAPATAQTIGVNVTGVTLNDTVGLGTGATPSDSMGAVGPAQFAEFVNGAYALYDKNTGNLIGNKVSDVNFWSNAFSNAGSTFNPSTVGITDPRIVYDWTSGRWFATQITEQTLDNQVLVAVSQGRDPSVGQWKAVRFTGNTGGTGRFLDFDSLGVNADGVYVGGLGFTSGSPMSAFTGASLFSIPKSDLLGTSPTLSRITRFDDVDTESLGIVFQPALSHLPSTGSEPVLSLNVNTGQINRFDVVGGAASGATLSTPVVLNTLPSSAPPEIHQPDGTQQIDSVDNRLASFTAQAGRVLYQVHAIDTGDNHSEIHWMKIDAQTNAVLQEGTLGDPTGHFDYFQPSISANASGTVVIGVNRAGDATTGTAGALSSYAVVGTTAAGVLSFSSPLLLKQGDVINYHLQNADFERWGDYSRTDEDPDNPAVFWTIQEFPLTTNRWATQITQITVPNGVLPGDLNDTGTVDFSDLLILAQNYGQSGATYAQGDINGDGTVDFSDLLALAQHYGQSADVIPPTTVLAAAVPEPGPAILLALAPLLGRRGVRVRWRPSGFGSPGLLD
jgi:hypothetical protein